MSKNGKLQLFAVLSALVLLRLLYIALLILVACLLMVTLLEYFLHYFNPTLNAIYTFPIDFYRFIQFFLFA